MKATRLLTVVRSWSTLLSLLGYAFVHLQLPALTLACPVTTLYSSCPGFHIVSLHAKAACSVRVKGDDHRLPHMSAHTYTHH
jgi:hypothetical protein